MTDEPIKTEEEEVTVSEKDETSTDGQMVPKSRLDKVIEQREEAIAKLEEKDEQYQSLQDQIQELKDLVQKKNDGDEFSEDEKLALSKIDKGLRSKYLTKEEYDSLNREQKREQDIIRLSGKYKEGSGFPVFKADEVLVHAKKLGTDNLEAAYRDLHWEAIAQQKASGINVPDSEKPSGQKTGSGVEMTRQDIAGMSDEEWNKNEASIMEKFKKSIFGK